MSKNVLVCVAFDGEQQETLRRTGAQVHFVAPRDVTPVLLRDADAVIGNLPTDLLRTAPHLSWVQLNSSGADAYTVPGVLGPDTVLTSATGAYGAGIAEYMVAMLLVMMKKIPAYLQDQAAGRWRDEGEVTSPIGRRVLVVGTGDIGTAFAARMRAFGCTLVGVRRRPSPSPAFDETYTAEALAEQVRRADVVALCLPGTPQTHHLFDQTMLSACKRGAYLLNVGRGNVIDTRVLAEPAVYQRFGGIWLDVCETEPLPSDDPLYTVPNLLLTPHITGGFHLKETCDKIFDICLDNLKSFLEGKALKHVVDRTSGYCK